MIVRSGQGEIVTDRESRRVELVAAAEQLSITWSSYAPGEPGPDPHVHREHTDSFWVLEGEMRFRVGPELDPVTLRAGDFLSVPPEVVHTFVAGDEDTRFVNYHSPDGGFAANLRGETETWDSVDASAGEGRPADLAVVARPGDGHRVPAGDSALVIKAGADSGAGHLALMDTALAPGFHGPPPHVHRAMIDCFYVLEGEVTFSLDGADHAAGPGDLAFVEPGTVHTFANRSGAPARFLNVFAPAGLDRYLVELGELTAAGRPLTPELMGELASRYDFERA